MNENDRRLKLLRIDEDRLCDMLSLFLGQPPAAFFSTLRLDPPLPQDVKIRSCHYEHDRAGFGFVLESEAFDPVSPYCLIPALETELRTVTHDADSMLVQAAAAFAAASLPAKDEKGEA